MLILPAFAVGLFAAYIAFMFSILLDQSCVRWALVLKLNVPPSLLLGALDVVFFFIALAIWTTTTAFAIGFSLRMSKGVRIQWGLTVALLLTSVYVWAKKPQGLVTPPHLAAVAAVVLLVCGVVLSFRRVRKVRTHFLTNAATLVTLVLPFLIALADAPKQPPTARRLWSTVLDKDTWQAMNTGSSFAATRQVVISGDRVLTIFDAGFAQDEGKQPMSNYRLLSLDAKTGEIKNAHDFVGHWGSTPYLFATNDDHVILEDGSLKAIRPDLSDAGPVFNPDRGRVDLISPDGSTMAWETTPGTTLLDSHTLTPNGKHLAESVPVSITTDAALTDNTYWYRDYPKDHSFVTLTNEHGQRLLFHGDCGAARFANRQTVIVVGCGKITTLNIQGTVLKESNLSGGPATFAGISQNGKRFALEFSDEKGDPSILLYEYFVVFDTDTLQPVAMVRVSEMPEHQSWSAFSSEGKYFVVGNPNDLSLYQLQ